MVLPALLVMVPLLVMTPPDKLVMAWVFTNIIPELIVRVSPELIVKVVTVHVLTPFHVPPIATHDGPSEMVPPVACAS